MEVLKSVSKLFLAFMFIIGIGACNKEDTTPVGSVDCAQVGYDNVIKSLIQSSCGNCHGSDSQNGVMTSYEELKVYAENGKLNKRVLTDQDMPMGSSLSSEQLGQLKCWLDAGAPEN